MGGGALLREIGASRPEMFMLDRTLLDRVRDLEKTQATSDLIPSVDTVQHSARSPFGHQRRLVGSIDTEIRGASTSRRGSTSERAGNH